MDYYDIWKKKMKAKEVSSTSDSILKQSRLKLKRVFKNHPSYKLGLIEKSNESKRNIDIRVVNIDQTTKNKRLHFLPDEKINEGDYIYYDDKCFILMEIEDNSVDIYSLAYKCKQTLNWKGLDKPVPCYCDNSSYGVKGVIDGTYIAEYDGKIQFFVQYNEKTKEIKQDMRFLFDNNKNSVYKIVDINRVVTGNVLRLVMDKVEFNPEKDDLENNIAHNEWLDVVAPEVPVVGEYSIKSSTESMEIHRWDEVAYTVLNQLGIEDEGVWDISVDYNGNPSDCIIVKEKGSNYIKITNDGYVGYEINLRFTKGDVSLVEKIRLVR